MSTPRRPSLAERTMSTPLSISTLSAASRKHQDMKLPNLGLDILTPPASPRHSRHSRSSSNLSNKTDDSLSDSKLGYRPQHSGRRTSDGVLICPFEVNLLKDQRGQDQVFGYGAWSAVLKGTCYRKPMSGLMTPPPSPLLTPPILVAVKQPARKDAKAILESEAKVSSHLSTEPGNERYIVAFYGILPSTSSLVLAAVPLSLDQHIKASARTATSIHSNLVTFEPLIGNTDIWLDLAYKLITGLHWLHDNAMVVHGDIKPGNILLERGLDDDENDTTESKNKYQFKPLFADFSSAQRLGDMPTPNTLSAITREYTAPELLSSKVLSNPNSTATTASDVFSLAVTLLVAASGNTMVYTGSMFQRQAMAMQGWMVIQAVRNGPLEEAARVPRQGVVDRALEQAVLRDGMGRISAASWKTKVGTMFRGEPTKL